VSLGLGTYPSQIGVEVGGQGGWPFQVGKDPHEDDCLRVFSIGLPVGDEAWAAPENLLQQVFS
jgi:hypothetical protein